MKIENENYVLQLTCAGGEMESLVNKKTGLEYLYDGKSEYWSGKNPGLFPIISNTYTKEYTIDNKTYAMKNHGLIRYATLTCVDEQEDHITMELKDSEETRAQYPFAFTYRVTYQIVGKEVVITYDITNDGNEVMPFMFGLHPAFLCPLTKTEKFEDYRLIFSSEERVTQLHFDITKEKPITYEDITVKEIPLTYDWIVKDSTVIYKGCHGSHVTLQGKEHGVKVSIAGYPYLAFWTAKEGAPFLCIEPWHGRGDLEKVADDFYHREGTLLLSPQKTFTTSYTIETF